MAVPDFTKATSIIEDQKVFDMEDEGDFASACSNFPESGSLFSSNNIISGSMLSPAPAWRVPPSPRVQRHQATYLTPTLGKLPSLTAAGLEGANGPGEYHVLAQYFKQEGGLPGLPRAGSLSGFGGFDGGAAGLEGKVQDLEGDQGLFGFLDAAMPRVPQQGKVQLSEQGKQQQGVPPQHGQPGHLQRVLQPQGWQQSQQGQQQQQLVQQQQQQWLSMASQPQSDHQQTQQGQLPSQLQPPAVQQPDVEREQQQQQREHVQHRVHHQQQMLGTGVLQPTLQHPPQVPSSSVQRWLPAADIQPEGLGEFAPGFHPSAAATGARSMPLPTVRAALAAAASSERVARASSDGSDRPSSRSSLFEPMAAAPAAAPASIRAYGSWSGDESSLAAGGGRAPSPQALQQQQQQQQLGQSQLSAFHAAAMDKMAVWPEETSGDVLAQESDQYQQQHQQDQQHASQVEQQDQDQHAVSPFPSGSYFVDPESPRQLLQERQQQHYRAFQQHQLGPTRSSSSSSRTGAGAYQQEQQQQQQHQQQQQPPLVPVGSYPQLGTTPISHAESRALPIAAAAAGAAAAPAGVAGAVSQPLLQPLPQLSSSPPMGSSFLSYRRSSSPLARPNTPRSRPHSPALASSGGAGAGAAGGGGLTTGRSYSGGIAAAPLKPSPLGGGALTTAGSGTHGSNGSSCSGSKLSYHWGDGDAVAGLCGSGSRQGSRAGSVEVNWEDHVAATAAAGGGGGDLERHGSMEEGRGYSSSVPHPPHPPLISPAATLSAAGSDASAGWEHGTHVSPSLPPAHPGHHHHQPRSHSASAGYHHPHHSMQQQQHLHPVSLVPPPAFSMGNLTGAASAPTSPAAAYDPISSASSTPASKGTTVSRASTPGEYQHQQGGGRGEKVIAITGGKFHRCGAGADWEYLGGDKKLVYVHRDCTVDELKLQLRLPREYQGVELLKACKLKYMLPGEAGDLIELLADDDVVMMWEEWDDYPNKAGRHSKLQLYVELPGLSQQGASGSSGAAAGAAQGVSAGAVEAAAAAAHRRAAGVMFSGYDIRSPQAPATPTGSYNAADPAVPAVRTSSRNSCAEVDQHQPHPPPKQQQQQQQQVQYFQPHQPQREPPDNLTPRHSRSSMRYRLNFPTQPAGQSQSQQEQQQQQQQQQQQHILSQPSSRCNSPSPFAEVSNNPDYSSSIKETAQQQQQQGLVAEVPRCNSPFAALSNDAPFSTGNASDRGRSRERQQQHRDSRGSSPFATAGQNAPPFESYNNSSSRGHGSKPQAGPAGMTATVAGSGGVGGGPERLGSGPVQGAINGGVVEFLKRQASPRPPNPTNLCSSRSNSPLMRAGPRDPGMIEGQQGPGQRMLSQSPGASDGGGSGGTAAAAAVSRLQSRADAQGDGRVEGVDLEDGTWGREAGAGNVGGNEGALSGGRGIHGHWLGMEGAGSYGGSSGSSDGHRTVDLSQQEQQHQQQLGSERRRLDAVDSRVGSGGSSSGNRSGGGSTSQGQRTVGEQDSCGQPRPQHQQQKGQGRARKKSLEQMRDELRMCVQELSTRLDIIQERDLALVRCG